MAASIVQRRASEKTLGNRENANPLGTVPGVQNRPSPRPNLVTNVPQQQSLWRKTLHRTIRLKNRPSLSHNPVFLIGWVLAGTVGGPLGGK